MLSVTSNLAWMKTPPSHCYSSRILWLFLLFCSGWLSDSPQGLPAKQQDPREIKVFLTPIAMEGLKCGSPPPPPPPKKQGVIARNYLIQVRRPQRRGWLWVVDEVLLLLPLAHWYSAGAVLMSRYYFLKCMCTFRCYFLSSTELIQAVLAVQQIHASGYVVISSSYKLCWNNLFL